MATTIQIKRGTGSAVPSNLEDGELAINLDNGKLYFGSASNSVSSFRFETLTAQKYIVSSSVTNITTQELSGSTAFGDSVDDTHQFTGALTASGNISASGNILGGGITISGNSTFNGSTITLGDVGGDRINANAAFATRINTLSHITASGNISSSGNIIAASLDAAAVSDTLAAAIVAEIDNDEIPIAKLAEDAVTVTAGTGLTGGGSITLGGSATVNVIGGDGITANANDMAITAAQTTITSILASDVKIGEDDETKIDFEEANEIHFYANNAQEMVIQANVVAPGADDGTALGDADQRWSDLFLAEGGIINFDNGDVTITQTGNKLAIEGTDGTSFVGDVTASGNISSSSNIIAVSMSAAAFSGDGSGITNITAVAADGTYSSSLQILSNITASGDISSSGTIIANAFVGNITGDLTGEADTVATIAGLAPNTATTQATQGAITSLGTLSALTVSGDITANGNIVGDDSTDITNIESIFADNLVHDGDTDTKIAFGTNQVSIKAGNTTVFGSTITGSLLHKVHQNVYDTGSLAISTANGAMGDIVKFGGTTTTAGGVYFLNGTGGWTLTQANAAATSTGSLAVAVGTNSTTHGMCLRGFVNPFTDPSAGIGSPVYLSDTHTGRMLAAPPSDTNDVVRIVGYQYGPDLIYFNPSNDFIIHA